MGNIAPMVIIGAIVSAWIALQTYYSVVVTARRRKRLASRPILSEQQWCDTYFPEFDHEGRKHAMAVCAIFAEPIGVAPTQLLPSDGVHFDYCLRGVWYFFDDSWELWTTELGQYVMNETHGRVTDAELEEGGNWSTLSEFVRETVAMVERHTNE